MILPHKTLERNLFKSGYRLIYAVDEVGMGCLAGPVVVCAVAMTNTFYNKAHKKLRRLRDSKLLSAKQREWFANQLLTMLDIGCLTSVAYCHPKTIDKLNIYQASRLAMRNALKKIKPEFNLKSIVLVDGNKKIPGLKSEQLAIVKGDRKIFAIACASIIAKVYRDKMMARYAKKYPGYGFEKHKGYGTKYHQAQLASLGPCSIHRRSFRLTYG
ncbi:MAG: ribonuclease HII [Candidatus Taylorbacteria bacterium]|nr:ribonuclease HII [Candidatus Taylorbacteria bacterium]